MNLSFNLMEIKENEAEVPYSHVQWNRGGCLLVDLPSVGEVRPPQ
jgi:hypothetical protein